MLDYATLRIIWWVLLGVLLIGFAVMDGFDLGVAALLPFLTRQDNERRIMINTVGPVWEGNQVWFILGGGAIFAAWPSIYAVSFSGFYIAMFVVLLSFIVRPVGFKYRSKLTHPTWRSSWDYALAIAAMVTSIVLGAAVGNVLQGVPFHFDHSLRSFYTGNFWQLLNPFALYCGVLSLLMLMMQGAVYLSNKTDGMLQQRARNMIYITAPLTGLLFFLGGFWLKHLLGYVVTSPIMSDGPSNPLYKTVVQQSGAWLNNYIQYDYLITVPLAGIIATLLVVFIVKKCPRIAIICSSLAIASIICSVGISMFPFILPSSSAPSVSLTVWDASSSKLTLSIMTIVTVIFMPIILLYTAWVYRVMRGVVTNKTIADNQQSY